MKLIPRRSRGRRAPSPATGTLARGALTRWDRVRQALSPSSVRDAVQRATRKIGLTRSGQIAAAGCVVMWVFAKIIGGKPIFLMAYGTALLTGVSYALSPRRLRLEGNRAGLFPRAHEGDRMEVEVQLTARRGISTFILEERVPERLGTPVRVPIPKLPAGSAVSHKYTLRATRRGVYEIGPLVAVTSDPLGLTQRDHLVADAFEMLVHPRVEFVSDRPLTRHFEDPPIRPPVSRPAPSGYELYGFREYQPGDDLRRISWRVTGRAGKVMVREAEQGITDQITLILDTNRGNHSRDGDYSDSFETGVRAAASLGIRHLQEGYEVRVECNGGTLFKAKRGPMAQLPFLDALTRVDMDRELLGKVLMRLVADAKRAAHNVLVTPKLAGADAAQLKFLLNRGVSVLVVALLWDEEDTETLNAAAALGCQVAAVHPGQDLTTALYQDIGAGNR
jgi:uncharacterized protein (DUF58 family)